MQLQRIAGLAVIAVGVVLLVMGFRATEAFGSQVSNFFTGAPTDRAIWLLIGGGVLVLGGAVLAAVPLKR